MITTTFVNNVLVERKLKISAQIRLGRIHSAVVSNIKPGTEFVTVEWFEKDETKGKEVFFYTPRLFSVYTHTTHDIYCSKSVFKFNI